MIDDDIADYNKMVGLHSQLNYFLQCGCIYEGKNHATVYIQPSKNDAEKVFYINCSACEEKKPLD